MEAKRYIFLSAEGFTFQPNSNLEKPDIENLQVIGFAKGRDSKDAFQQLLKENSCLIDTSFDEVFSYELSEGYEETRMYYCLSDLR